MSANRKREFVRAPARLPAADAHDVSRTTSEDYVTPETRILQVSDRAQLDNVAPGVFDNDLDPRLVTEFLSDNRHHLVVAVDNDQVIGFASGVHYVHPDKPSELWINEVGVAPIPRARCWQGSDPNALATRGAFGLPRSVGAHRPLQSCRDASVYLDGGPRRSTDQVMFTFFLDPEPSGSSTAGNTQLEPTRPLSRAAVSARHYIKSLT